MKKIHFFLSFILSILFCANDLCSQTVKKCYTNIDNYVGPAEKLFGNSYMFSSESHLVKVDENGLPLWSKDFRSYDIRQMSDSSVVLCSMDSVLNIARIDINGNVLWSKDLSGSNYQPLAYDVSPDDHIFVLCSTEDSTGHLIELNQNGSVLSSKNMGHGKYFKDIAFLQDGSYILLTYQFVTYTTYHYMISRHNPDGSVLWTHTIGDYNSDVTMSVGNATIFLLTNNIVAINFAGNVLWSSHPTENFVSGIELFPANDSGCLVSYFHGYYSDGVEGSSTVLKLNHNGIQEKAWYISMYLRGAFEKPNGSWVFIGNGTDYCGMVTFDSVGYPCGIVKTDQFTSTSGPFVMPNADVLLTDETIVLTDRSLVLNSFDVHSYDNCLSIYTAVPEITLSPEIKITPNPVVSSSVITVTKEFDGRTAILYSSDGKEISRFRLFSSGTPFANSDLAPGIYFLRIEGEMNTAATRIVVK